MSKSSRPVSPRDDALGAEASELGGADAAPLLRVLGIMNSDGSISADSRRKFKQVSHLIPLLVSNMVDLPKGRPVDIVDLNCGNAYLGLILGWWLVRQGVACRLLGVDRDPARIDACRRKAKTLGFHDAEFEVGDALTYPLPDSPFAVLSLHGCDTATDDALVRAVATNAEHLLAVPCCHREVRTLLAPSRDHAPFIGDGILEADHAAILTDALRMQWLRAQGYRTGVIEFVPWEHTPRNRLVRARRGLDATARSRARLIYSEACAGLKSPPSVLQSLE